MRLLIIAILSILFTVNSVGQNLSDYDGFKNKAEAKNLRVNGLKEGKWLEYIDDSNEVTIDTNAPYYKLSIYQEDTSYGTMREYYKSDKIFVEVPVDSNGFINGIVKEYYESGILKEEALFVNDIKNGIEKEFYENRKLKRETTYKLGTPNGVEKIYYESGALNAEAHIIDGKTIGVSKEYYESGKLKGEAPYTDDKENGIEKVYYESGKIQTESIYANDTLVSTRNYDESGTEIKGK